MKATIHNLKNQELAVKIHKYITDNPVFIVGKLAEEADISRMHMHYFVANGRPLEMDQVKKLADILKRYGFKK